MDTYSQEVKDYLDRRFAHESPEQHAMRKQAVADGIPEIHIPIHLGKFLSLLTQVQHAERVLEIGTLVGYSASWLLRGLKPQGKLISLELNPEYAAKAQKHFESIEEDRVQIRVGHAVDLLAQLAVEEYGPFDLIFIDADKENYSLYLDWSIRLGRPGALILIDNLIPKGERVGYSSHHQAHAVYEFNDYLATHPQLEVAAFPSLSSSQGRIDGLALAYVR